MSSLTTLARPYAKAAFGLAQESDGSASLGHWQSMLDAVSQLAADKSVAGVLENPLVSPAQAVELLSSIAGEEADAQFVGFLNVLGENRRLPLLPEITALFTRLKQDAEKRLHVRAVSAIELDEDQISRICDALASRFNREIELDTEIDENILGGAVLYAGDQVIDGSLRGRLDKLVNSLAQ